MPKTPMLTTLAASLPSTVPFVGPETQERQRARPFRARLGANESGFGPAPSVIAAMKAASESVWMYGDPENHNLRAALAASLGISAMNVAVGEGIDGLLGVIVRLFVEPGAVVATSLGAYPTFNYHVAGFGGRLVTTPYVNDREDFDGLLDLVRREDASVVYLANPDNPMASWWSGAEVARFAASLPERSLLVLDEAYCEFAPADALPILDVDTPNVLRLRTFSKAHGLAGLRIGYAFGNSAVISAFDRVRNHFGVSRIAQVAAEAALSDGAYITQVLKQVTNARTRLARIAGSNGLTALPSATNFVTMDCGRDGEFAMAVMKELVARDVFIRKPMAPGLDRCIRVSVGPDAELDVFEEMLPEALAVARSAAA